MNVQKTATALLLLVATLAAGQNPVSLAEALDYAYNNNPSIRVARLQISDAEWRVKESTGSGLPQVTAGLNYQYFFLTPVAVLPEAFGRDPQTGELDPNFDRTQSFALSNSLTGNVSVNYLVFSNSYRLALRGARFYRALVQEQYQLARQSVRNQVIDSYLPALLIEDNLAIFEKNIANLEKLLSETRAIQQAGYAEQLDVDRLELSLSSLRTERENLRRQHAIVVNALKFTMGYPVTDSLALRDNAEQLLATYGQADLTSAPNYQDRPEYTQLQRSQELSDLQIELHSKPWLPNVAVFAQYQPGLSGNNLFKESFFVPQGLLGLSVNFNIWDGGQTRARRERAVIALQSLLEQKGQLENAINLELENARKGYLNAAERVRNQQRNLDLAQRIYETTQIKYKAGVGSSFELVSAEQQLTQAQQALMQSRFDLLTANVGVRKALGITQ
jgi:outer membrane protein